MQHSRLLSSQESQGSVGGGGGGGGHWDDDEGMIRMLQAQAGSQFDYELGQSASQSSSQQTAMHEPFDFDQFTLSQPQIPTLLSGHNNPTPPPSSSPHDSPYPQHIAPAQLALNIQRPSPVDAYPSPISTAPPTAFGEYGFPREGGGSGNHRRAESAASHRTTATTSNSVSGGSEFSYSATDLSEVEDVEMGQEGADAMAELNLGRMKLKGEKTWTQYDQDAVGKGKGAVVGGPMRRPRGQSAAQAEEERLEHRRSINRKSAQKHRAQRKKQVEDLEIQVKERDERIAQLMMELAVERAKSQQLISMVKGTPGAPIPPSAGSVTQPEDEPGRQEPEVKEGSRRVRGSRASSGRVKD